jgi:oligoendopeptidase F
LHSYAYLRFYGDTSDLTAKKLLEQVSQLSAEYSASIAFLEPEILKAPRNALLSLIAESEALKVYQYRIDEIERARPHTHTPEIEAILAEFEPLEAAMEDLRTVIHDNEMKFTGLSVNGVFKELVHGNYDQFLTEGDREVRRRAYLNYTDSYLLRLPSLGEALTKRVTHERIFTKVRGFKSSFEASLFNEGYSSDVFWSVINSCVQHRPLIQRYFKARAKLLSLDKIAEYDLMAPLSYQSSKHVPYDKGCEMILSSLRPLGDEYVSVARNGLTAERWVDVHPRQGKYSNAFSGGSYLTRPFILINYSPTVSEVGTLAHELGHSMHSYLTNRCQPPCYAHYSMSVAETASNLNQVLLRAELFSRGDSALEIAALEEALFFVHRYLFLMPNLALLEVELHKACADGEPMGWLDICNETERIFREAYGDSVEFEGERVASKWAQFCHLYRPFYTYQYAIGISAAMAIGGRILSGEVGLVERYHRFLSLGSSMAPLDIFKVVGLDFTTPQPLKDAFRVVEGYVERLEGIG